MAASPTEQMLEDERGRVTSGHRGPKALAGVPSWLAQEKPGHQVRGAGRSASDGGAHMFAAGHNKLSASASSLRVTRFVTPVAAVVAALGALTAAGPVLMRWLQTHPQCRVQATLSRLERAAARHGGKSA